MKFEQLDAKKHDTQAFDCGVKAPNKYLQQYANQDQQRGLTRVFVLAEQTEIIGYYTISAHCVATDHLPEDSKLSFYQEVPFLLLGRLAVAKKHKRQGFAAALTFHAFKTTSKIAEKVGVQGIIVDAKNETAVYFYEGFGFKRLQCSVNCLMLPFAAMKALL
jgi:ribosomal protein S18 acetylase RimI-like enzyme